ncbi:MAG: response regulator transcription factor [Chloroflexi bacterium]|nr:response regulator transcription factor [Chloroflexota bacterium]
MSDDGQKIRVMVVDDHGMVREGLRTYLELEDDLEIIGEAANGREAVAQARVSHPDVILMDLLMPEMDGISAIKALRESEKQDHRTDKSRVLVLTSFAEDEQIVQAIRAGADGYLLKDVAADELVKAIRAVAKGQVQLHPDVARKLMSQMASPHSSNAEPDPGLTERELEVLRHIAQGESNKEIAAKLVVSERTVKGHVSNILAKLNLADRTQAALYAVRHHLADE